MKNLILFSAVTVFSGLIMAQEIEFSSIDADSNGVLSVEEASAALPAVTFTDTNGDGVLSEAEAEDAVEGLSLPVEDQGDDNETVDADDFVLIAAAAAE